MSRLADESQFRTAQIQIETLRSRIDQTRGELNCALAANDRGLSFCQESDTLLIRLGPLATRSQIYLRMGRREEAVELAEPLVPLLVESDELMVVDDLMDVYLIVARVLRAVADPRADRLLRVARERLLAWAEGISNPQRRQSFLNATPSHQTLMDM